MACYLSFVVCPHAQDLYDAFFFQDLIYQPVLNIDSPRISPLEISDQPFELRWVRNSP
jgi:hypothetical protein